MKIIKINFEKLYPYVFSSSLCLLWIFFYYFIENKYVDIFHFNWDISPISNTIITIISIFVWFLWVWMTLVLENWENENIKIIKANNKYKLLLSYFKEPIIIWMIIIAFSIFLSLWITLNKTFTIIYVSSIILILSLNYRVIKFLFKIFNE